MDYKKEIINTLRQISGRYSMYEVFHDWIKCSSIAIQNTYSIPRTKLWKLREQEYIDIMKKYQKEEGLLFSKMLFLLEIEFQNGTKDILGEIYMESEMGSKSTGQFFTPYKVSNLLSEIGAPERKEDGKYFLYEPTCGSGGSIIAAADVLYKKGIDFKRDLEVVAQDLDWKSVYMCYLQLSILGIQAICVQGDTLEKRPENGYNQENVLYTPAKIKEMMKK